MLRRAVFLAVLGLATLGVMGCAAFTRPSPSPSTPAPATTTPGPGPASPPAPVSTPTDGEAWDSLLTFFEGFGGAGSYTWQTDVSKALISPREIQFLYAPRAPPIVLEAQDVESVEQANEWLSDLEPVVAVELNGEARAYPLQIQIYVVQEIVNDHLGGAPIAVAY